MKINFSNTVKDSIEALSIKYNNIVYEKQQKNEDVIVLSLGEPFFDLPLLSFEKLPYPNIYHYSHSRGILELRKKIMELYKSYDSKVDFQKEILVTAGSKIAIHMAFMSMLNPKDEVIIHEPAWVSYPEEIKLCYGIPKSVPFYETVYDFEKYISSKTKLIIINSPNNPTGKTYTEQELVHVLKLAKEYDLIIISDEAYSDYFLDNKEFNSMVKIDNNKEHSIVINSLSKNMGISGWRIGYIISNKETIDQILKLNQHLITCAPTILQYYVNHYFWKLLKLTKPQIKKLLEKRNLIKEFMNSVNLKYLDGNSTYYFFVSISDSKMKSDEFCTKLLETKNISVVPGIGYGKSCDEFVRVSIGTEPIQRIKNALLIIKDFINSP